MMGSVQPGSTPALRVLYLTDNPTLGGTIRILQSWLIIGRAKGLVHPAVAVPPSSAFCSWLRENQVAFVTNPFPVPDKRRPWLALWHAVRLALWARRHRIQLIHCNEHNIYPFATLLRRLTGVPLVCHVRYRIARDYALWAFDGPTRRPDALLWTSAQQRQDCAAAIDGIVPDGNQYIVPLGVDLEVFGSKDGDRRTTRTGWGFPDDAIVIGQACALRARKRIEEFVDLVYTLAQEDERVVGALAGDAMPGDEAYRDQVLRHIEQRNLGPRFIWLGNMDNIEPFDHAIDLFVSTSEYETFGNSVCEAMACGKPIVAYRGGSVHEVVGDAGTIVPDKDLAGLTAAARRYVHDPAVRRDHGERARRRIRDQFSPAQTLTRLLEIYKPLLEQA